MGRINKTRGKSCGKMLTQLADKRTSLHVDRIRISLVKMRNVRSVATFT